MKLLQRGQGNQRHQQHQQQQQQEEEEEEEEEDGNRMNNASNVNEEMKQKTGEGASIAIVCSANEIMKILLCDPGNEAGD